MPLSETARAALRRVRQAEGYALLDVDPTDNPHRVLIAALADLAEQLGKLQETLKERVGEMAKDASRRADMSAQNAERALKQLGEGDYGAVRNKLKMFASRPSWYWTHKALEALHRDLEQGKYDA